MPIVDPFDTASGIVDPFDTPPAPREPAPVLSQGKGVETSLWDSFTSLFTDPGKESAQAVQALVDAEAFKIRPSEAMRYRDMIDEGVKINPKAAAKRSSLMQRIQQSFDIGVKQNQIGEIGYLYVKTGDPKHLEEMAKISLPGEGDIFIPESRLEKYFSSAAKMLPMSLDSMREGGEKGLKVGMALAGAVALAGQAGPQIATPEEIITVPTAALAGFTAGSISGTFEASLRKEAGLALSEIITFKDKDGRGIDPDIARAAAYGIGAINAGIEVAQIGTLLKTVPGFNKMFSKAVMDTVSSKAVKDKLLNLAGQYAGTVTKETAQEVAQESTNIIFEELSKKVNNSLKGTDIKPTDATAIMKRLWETAQESAQAFSVMAAPGISAKAVMAPRGEKAETTGANRGTATESTEKPQDEPKAAPQREYTGPIVLGVEEDATGRTTGFLMADQRTGETFSVGALEKEIDKEGNALRYEADPEGVAAAMAAIRAKGGEDIGVSLDQIIQGPEDSDAVISRIFGEEGPATTQAPEQTILDHVKAVNEAIGNKGELDLTPLVNLGRAVWDEGKTTFSAFQARVKEVLGPAWEKVKEYARQAWDLVSNERGSFSRKRTVYNEVMKSGGLDPDKIKTNHDWHEDIIEYGLMGLTKKGGNALDDLATEYQGRGIIPATPREFSGPGEFLLDVLKKEKAGVEREAAEAKAQKAEQERMQAELWADREAFKEGKKEGQRKAKEAYKADIADMKVELEAKFRKQLQEAVKKAQDAWREGYKEGAEKWKEEALDAMDKLKWIQQRREQVAAVRDFLELSDDDMRKISRKNPLLMGEAEFHQYLSDLQQMAVEFEEHRQAKLELIHLINERRLQKVDNYRQALDLPAIDKMTTEQLREFAALLQPFQEGDVFLTKRELETVERTDLGDIKTWREAREKLALEVGLTVEDFEGIRVVNTDSFRWDTSLYEKNPFYEWLVSQVVKATVNAEMAVHKIEDDAFKLAKASEKSRGRSLMERMIPQDSRIMEWLEATEEDKAAVAEDMTPEQLNYGFFIQQYFAEALEYLISVKALEKGRDNYMVHIRKTFLESWKDNGLMPAIKSMFRNYQQDQAVFNILDDDTGNILPLEKFFQFALHRTGELDPTSNVTRAFMTYVKTLEKKKTLDALIPKIHIYTQALTPARYTPRGLEYDASLKKFVNKYVNNKKGRHVSFDSVIKQGGAIDWGITAMRTFTTLLDLGLNIPVGIASFFGEQAATFEMMGIKNYFKGVERMATSQGRAILKRYEAYVGRSLWEEFREPGKQINERMTTALFGLFHASSVKANSEFLLGSLTPEEWKTGEISPERLAEMKLEMGRFRAVPGSNSLVGSTSLGKGLNQYKSWAVPIMRTLTKDLAAFAKDLKRKAPGEALTSREAKELYRFVGLTSAVLIVGAAAGAESEDDSFIGKLRKRIYNESMTLMQGVDPKLWLSIPRAATWIAKLGTNIHSLILLEEYQTKEGLKGWEGLKAQFTPSPLRKKKGEE